MKTREQKYLETRGLLCPYCDSNDLQTDGTEFQENICLQDIICNGCNKTWVDAYTLTWVNFEEDEDLVTEKDIKNDLYGPEYPRVGE